MERQTDKAEVTREKSAWLLGKAIEAFGRRPINEITPPMALAPCRKLESEGNLHSAHRLRAKCSQVFRYAVSTGRAERDPTADLQGALKPPVVTHRAAITDPKQTAQLLRDIDSYQGTFVVKCALKLAPMLFVRPGELRAAEWAEIDLEAGIWEIPAARMKMKQPHLVPLATQAVAILRDLHALTGTSTYVFRSTGKSGHLSETAVLNALRRMGYANDEMSGHGFRATARTILDEVLQVRPDLIEHQLAHAVKDANGRAYNRTSHLPERRKMMQLWADYLDGLKAGAVVVPFKKAEAKESY